MATGAGAGDGTPTIQVVPGDVVLTTFGVGVVVMGNKKKDDEDKNMEDDGMTIRVRIWRVPECSIGSAAVAHLRCDAIVKHLPVAPGMITEMMPLDDKNEGGGGRERVLVHCYSESSDTYLVSSKSNSLEKERKARRSTSFDQTTHTEPDVPNPSNQKSPPTLISVRPSQLAPGASAKFYPLIDELMNRADSAASSAASAFLAAGGPSTATTLAAKSSKLIDQATSDAVGEKAKEALSKEKIDAVKSTLQEEVLPEAKKGMQEIYTMLRDDEFTVLLEKGRERLKQLVSDEIPKATELTLKSAGIEIEHKDVQQTVASSRQKALDALNALLASTASTDLKTVQSTVAENFASSFDTMAEAARSDRTLSSIFQSVSTKTAKWQEETNRLASTRSVSLFVEGGQRLRTRAAAVFGKEGQLAWAKESGERLTRAFTEGDTAVARLKSIELGEAVRGRLVSAIEMRSDSLGGLDGIIAEALKSVPGSPLAVTDGDDPEKSTGDMVHIALANLQQSASGAAKNAHETLISVLSQRSLYRDLAILRIEQVFVDLESHLGEDMTPEQIAAIARGEGGTAALFEPIAKRAAKEIEKQLDLAEKSVADNPTVLAVLQRVRKIVSGELTLESLVDEMTSVLNDEKVVAAGENIVQQGELVLDAIEGVSGNKVVGDVMTAVEKAGLTKDAVMEHVEKLNIDTILDTAESAVNDKKSRLQLLSLATDSALDFMLKILPSMPVPPFDGVKDGLLYHISNLSMEGFKVKKEDIMVEIAGIRASQLKSAKTKEQNETSSPNDINLETKNSEFAETVTNGDETHQPSPISHTESQSSHSVEEEIHTSTTKVKPTELLIIDVQNISAILDDAVWSFEQTYLPYLKGKGKANVKLSNGSIRLRFELRKKKRIIKTPQAEEKKVNDNEEEDGTNEATQDEIQPSETDQSDPKTDSPSDTNSIETEEEHFSWEPVLCLHDRICSIGEVNLKLQGEGRLTWIVNKLASIFKGPLRDYVVQVVLSALTNRSGWLLEKLNGVLDGYWDMIMRTAGFTMDDLVEVSNDDVTMAVPDPHENEVHLVWREHLPLGINLLLNDDSGCVKVVDFPRGSQARKVASERGIDADVFKGATLMAVNGTRYVEGDQDDILDALRDPGRPKTIHFKLANDEDAERVRRFVEEIEGPDSSEGDPSDDVGLTNSSDDKVVKTVDIVETGNLGIQFAKSQDNFCLQVRKFLKDSDGVALAAEKSGNIATGDLLSHINGSPVLGDNGAGTDLALSTFESIGSTRPLSLGFVKPYLHLMTFENLGGHSSPGGPDELIFEEKKAMAGSNRILLKKFLSVSGSAESSGIFLGDHLTHINSNPVGAGCRISIGGPTPSIDEVKEMLKNPDFYPINLVFARPRQGTSRWNSNSSSLRLTTADNISVTCMHHEQLGFKLAVGQDEDDYVVTDFFPVKGFIQRQLRTSVKTKSAIGLALESIDGEVVPSYATSRMVTNALKRSWSTNSKVEMQFSNDDLREWVSSLTPSQNGSGDK